MDIKYKQEQIQTIIASLNKITITGLSNASIILNIVDILSNPIVEVNESKIVVEPTET